MSLIASATAEWICTRCGATNRMLVAGKTTTAIDRCVTCHARHEITEGSRPVRWDARLKD
jgi:DNA-directed RNA polymerase subunit RPC12/RpoP